MVCLNRTLEDNRYITDTTTTAEDYYGNDYPEDEVNSDDEFGRGAYDYRHAASDGEEFGWSEDE